MAVDGCMDAASYSSCTDRQWYHSDALGSPVARTDGSGHVVARLDYQAWGEQWLGASSGVLGDRQYNGRVYDAGTGFHDYGARMYWPQVGRFVSADPVAGDPSSPPSLNRYSYVHNNPYKYVDPSGRSIVPVIDLAFMAFDAGMYVYHSMQGDSHAAMVDAAALGLDAAFLLVPALPGAGLAARAADHAGTVLMHAGTEEGARAAVKAEQVVTKEVIERKSLGGDGATSRHIKEKIDGETISKTHQVTKDGETIHQHQEHIGKSGGERRFPDEWTGTQTINAPEHTPRTGGGD